VISLLLEEKDGSELNRVAEVKAVEDSSLIEIPIDQLIKKIDTLNNSVKILNLMKFLEKNIIGFAKISKNSRKKIVSFFREKVD